MLPSREFWGMDAASQASCGLSREKGYKTEFFWQQDFTRQRFLEVYEHPNTFQRLFPTFVSFVLFCLTLKGLQKQTKATKKNFPL
jgi:hypothetical protein